jgi:alpha-glucosidase
MRRREFLGASGSALAAAALPALPVAAQTTANEQHHVIGDFILIRDGNVMRVVHQKNPAHVLWESPADGNFLAVEVAKADIRSFGTPEGAYEIRDNLVRSYGGPSIESIDLTSARAVISGSLHGSTGKARFRLVFEAVTATHLRFEIAAEGLPEVNRILLRSASVPDEAFFGFGQQLTFFNQKGKLIPIVVQEHGVGRGRPIVTQLIDVFAHGGGGNPYITEAPAPHFISSRSRSLFLENTEYGTFDMRPAKHFEIKVWSGVMKGRILFGETPLDLVEAYTEYSGRMRALPNWIHNGAIVAVQGGTKAVRAKLDKLRKADIPVSGLWIQDWPGARVTSAGKQLWWDWRLDEKFYPEWRELVRDLESAGGRMLIYINPFLSNAKGHDALFNEGQQKGFLVKKADGSPYMIKNTDFYAGLIDLTNPGTRSWIKDVIKREMIGKAGASGWMADFGEAMPFDGKLHGDIDPAAWHNLFSQEWARVNREAIEEAGRGDDIVFFSRSGFTQSPRYSTLFWLGDQMQTWDEYDGIKSAVVGMLSGGVSGFSLLHSDVGGYVTLSLHVAGKKIPVVARSDELLQRWMELAAFTSVFRTHEGLDPDISAQFDSNPANTAHLNRFAKIYKALAPYRKRVVADAVSRGYPVTRHPFLHFPDDPNTHSIRYQYMLGPDLLFAPVLDKGAQSVDVYFPAGSYWVDLWSGTDAGAPGTWKRMPAPLSTPAVFLRKNAAANSEITGALKQAGVL